MDNNVIDFKARRYQKILDNREYDLMEENDFFHHIAEWYDILDENLYDGKAVLTVDFIEDGIKLHKIYDKYLDYNADKEINNHVISELEKALNEEPV